MTNDIALGGVGVIDNIHIGSDKVDQVYVGSELVWEKVAKVDLEILVTSPVRPMTRSNGIINIKDNADGTWTLTSNDNIISIQISRQSDITEVDLISCHDTMESIGSLFSGNTGLTSVTIRSGFDTSNVTNMQNMFRGCSSLENVDLSNLDTSSVIDMNGIFSGCSKLKTLDLNTFDFTNVDDTTYIFGDCTSLTCITNIDTTGISDTTKKANMFDNTPLMVSPNATEQIEIMSTAGLNYTNPNPCP